MDIEIVTDGSVIVVEIKAGSLMRISVDRNKEVFAETGGGPNETECALHGLRGITSIR
jgi:hypothetical protein